MVDLEKIAFQKALKKNVKIALGTDAGGFDWKGLNEAEEFVYYANYGMTPMQAIRSGTVVPAELLGWSDKVGTIEKGKWADIVAVSGDPRTGFSAAHAIFIAKLLGVWLVTITLIRLVYGLTARRATNDI